MPIDFPSGPTTGQVYTYEGRSWVWNGSAWDAPRADIVSILPSLTTGNTFTGNQTFNSGIVRMPSQPAFSAYGSGGPFAATQTVPYNVAPLNRGNHYNTSNYRFTAPVAGVYRFNVYGIGSTSAITRFQLFKNSTNLRSTGEAHQLRANQTSDYTSATATWLVSASANDFFYVQVYAGSDLGGIDYSHFMGHLVG